MGATKTNHYSYDVIKIANLANALGHPARITIIKALKENVFVRNSDFQNLLQLSQTAVHSHLLKLKTAKIIQFQYSPHEYQISLVPENLEELDYFLNE